MTRPRKWTPERVAELKRRMAEEGATLQSLGDEHGISKQAVWTILNRDAFNAYRREIRRFGTRAQLAEWGEKEKNRNSVLTS